MSDETQALLPSGPSPEARLDNILAVYLRQLEEGVKVDQQALLTAHPDLADELREFFGNQMRMQRLVGAGPISRNGAPPSKLRYFGDYEILEEIAHGGMGVVYKARQTTLNRIVAVKMILAGQLANESDVKRFQAEAEAAANLHHPGVVGIYEVGVQDGQHYYSMEYIHGQNLSQLIREKPLPIATAAEYVRDIAVVLEYAHQNKVLHRDLKPSNILLDASGRVRITDFGLAKRVEAESDLTMTGQVLGTPSYMSPEQAAAQHAIIGPATDIYALGAILYELVTGRPPFRSENVGEILRQVQHDEPVRPRLLNPKLPRDLETICLKCLEKEPRKRYGSAQLLANDLGRYLRGEPILARPISSPARAWRWCKRNPAATGFVFATSIAVLALVGVVVGQHYNAQLQTANASLTSVNGRLETANTSLKTTSDELQTTVQAVKVAEAKARRYLYAAQMAQVEQARQLKQPDRVVQLLRSVIPEDESQEDPRGFEWHHLWRLYHGEQSRLRGHKGAVRAVSFSPDDRLLASAGDDTTIKLWDTMTGKERFTLRGHTAKVTGVSFSSNGKRLASCSADKTIRIWDLEARRELRSLDGHTAAVTSVAFSPDDRYVASGAEDKTIRVWDITTGQLFKMKTLANTVSGVAFNFDGKKLACVTHREQETAPSSPLLWEPFTGTEVTLVGRSSQSAVSFSPDGAFIATGDDAMQGSAPSGGLRSRVGLWDVKGGGELKSFGEHESNITHVVFSPNGRRLASSSLDRTVKVWDVATHAEVMTLHEESGTYAVAFSPDSLRLASGSGDGTVKLWSMPEPGAEARLLKITDSVNNGALSQGVKIQNATTTVNNVAFSPDGKRIAGVRGGHTIVWSFLSGQEMLRLSGGAYSRAQWSPDGRFLAIGSEEIWDGVTGAVHAPIGHNSGKRYTKVAFTTDAKFLAEANATSAVRVLNTATGEVHNTFPLPKWATCVAISPDNKLLAAGSGSDTRHKSGAVKIWNLGSGTNGVSLEEAFYLSVWDVAFSPDGTQLAAAVGDYKSGGRSAIPGEVVVWDVNTGVALHRLKGHRSCIWAVAFSPDGKRLASVSGHRLGAREPGEVKMWDLTTGQEVCTFPGHTGAVYGVAFSPCGRRLATGSADGTVRIWDGTPLAETPSRIVLAVGK